MKEKQQQETVDWIKKQMKERGMTYRDLEKVSGVSRSAIGLALQRKRAMSTDFIYSMADAFGVPRLFLLRMAGIIEPAADMDRQDEEILLKVQQLDDDLKPIVNKWLDGILDLTKSRKPKKNQTVVV